MKTKLCTLLLLLICSLSYSQKVDIDNTRITVEYASLPIHKTSPDQRTYSLEVTGDYKFDTQEIGDALNLRGWTYVPESGAVHAKLKVSDFVRGKMDYRSEKKSSKSKDGKVTNWTEYTYFSTNTGLAYLSIYGPLNKYLSPERETKASARKAKEKEEEEKAKADNPFLKGVDTSTAEEESESELAGRYDLTQRYEVVGTTSKNSKEAHSSYLAKANESYARQVDQYANTVINRTNYSLNKTYGYNRLTDRAKFKTLDSKKHPEYEMYKNATEAMKAILATKKFNKNMDEVIASMEPILGYFRTVVDKYGADDKHEKRLKAATLYNMAQIYYYLDMPDKVIEIGNEFIAWDNDVKIGKNFIEKAEDLQHLLAFHEVSGRYFETNEDADTIEAEVSEEDDDEESGR